MEPAPDATIKRLVTAAATRRNLIAGSAVVALLLLATTLLAGLQQVGSASRFALLMDRRLQSAQLVADPVQAGGVMFQLTQHTYKARKHGDACTWEFGSEWATADWDRDLLPLNTTDIESLCDRLGIRTTFNQTHIFVTRGGRDYWLGRRAYFFERHDGTPPGNWLVHDIHGDITLGSWFGFRAPALCRLVAPAAAPAPVTPAVIDVCGEISARRVFDVQWSGDMSRTTQHCSGFDAPFDPAGGRLSVDRSRDSFRLGRQPGGSLVLQHFDGLGKLKNQLLGGEVKLASEEVLFYIIDGWFGTIITRSDKYREGDDALFTNLTRDPVLREC